jgi:hypothetical protein
MNREELQEKAVEFVKEKYKFSEHDMAFYDFSEVDDMAEFAEQILESEYERGVKETKPETVKCECGKEVPLEFATIDDDGCWTCSECMIDYLKNEYTKEMAFKFAEWLINQDAYHTGCEWVIGDVMWYDNNELYNDFIKSQSGEPEDKEKV